MKPKETTAIRKDLGENIRKAREEAGLTQVEVATLAKIDANYYARIERGLANPSFEKLHSIMKALKMEGISIN